jgi:hypothetical protein
VVNVDVQSKAGTHWVVAEWSRKDSRVELRLLDPMVDTAGAEQIKKIVTHNQRCRMRVTVTALKWQSEEDGWRCGYYSLFYILYMNLVVEVPMHQ